MYGERTAPAIDLARFQLTRTRVFALSALLFAISVTVCAMQFSATRNYTLPAGSVIGGDYLAFYTAGKAVRDGEAAAAYDPEKFEERLLEFPAPRTGYGLTWQYPPTYFFLMLPLAFVAFLPGYALWTGATAAAFFASLRAAGFRGLFLFVVLAAPSTFHAVITGQNGFLTAALLTLAAIFPDRRPIVAGIAAALLTVKPQLGLLIPFAYLAGGCWRAFFAAAIGAAALAGASVFAFGAESWTAFAGAVFGASDNLAAGAFPLYKMATPFAAAKLAGAPVWAAAAFHGAFALAAAGFVVLVWRRVKDAEMRAAALCTSVFFAAPYGYYYELVILALPALILAKRGLERGWLKYEQIALSFVFIAPLFVVGDAKKLGTSFAFFVVLALAATLVRRLAHDCPALFEGCVRKPAPPNEPFRAEL